MDESYVIRNNKKNLHRVPKIPDFKAADSPLLSEDKKNLIE